MLIYDLKHNAHLRENTSNNNNKKTNINCLQLHKQAEYLDTKQSNVNNSSVNVVQVIFTYIHTTIQTNGRRRQVARLVHSHSQKYTHTNAAVTCTCSNFRYGHMAVSN